MRTSSFGSSFLSFPFLAPRTSTDPTPLLPAVWTNPHPHATIGCVCGERALGPQKVVWQWRVTCWTYGQVTPHVLYSLYPLRRILSLGKFDFSSRRALPTIKYSLAWLPRRSAVKWGRITFINFLCPSLSSRGRFVDREPRATNNPVGHTCTHAHTHTRVCIHVRCRQYRCVSKKGEEWIVRTT